MKTGEVDYGVIRRTEERITQHGLDNSSARIYAPGTLLVAMYGQGITRGRVAILGIEAAINQACAAIAVGDRIDSHFLFFAFVHRYDEIRELGHGANQRNLNMQILRSVEFPVPPLPEQRAIAQVLRTVQRAKEATEKVLAATKQLKQSLLRHLFTYGPVLFDQAEQVELKETEIGPMPVHWELRQLVEVASIERGKFMHRPRNEPRFYGGRYPFIQTGDVARSGGRIRTFSQTLNDEGLAISRLFKRGTIVVTIAANIGDTAVLDFDCAFPDSLVGILPFSFMDGEFLGKFLQTQKDEMDRLAPRGTQKNINIRFLQPWPTPVPPMQSQTVIAHVLNQVDGKIAAEQARQQALSTLFNTLLHHLMTGKVRVV